MRACDTNNYDWYELFQAFDETEGEMVSFGYFTGLYALPVGVITDKEGEVIEEPKVRKKWPTRPFTDLRKENCLKNNRPRRSTKLRITFGVQVYECFHCHKRINSGIFKSVSDHMYGVDCTEGTTTRGCFTSRRLRINWELKYGPDKPFPHYEPKHVGALLDNNYLPEPSNILPPQVAHDVSGEELIDDAEMVVDQLAVIPNSSVITLPKNGNIAYTCPSEHSCTIHSHLPNLNHPLPDL